MLNFLKCDGVAIVEASSAGMDAAPYLQRAHNSNYTVARKTK
jgi:hypothetical protein